MFERFNPVSNFAAVELPDQYVLSAAGGTASHLRNQSDGTHAVILQKSHEKGEPRMRELLSHVGYRTRATTQESCQFRRKLRVSTGPGTDRGSRRRIERTYVLNLRLGERLG